MGFVLAGVPNCSRAVAGAFACGAGELGGGLFGGAALGISHTEGIADKQTTRCRVGLERDHRHSRWISRRQCDLRRPREPLIKTASPSRTSALGFDEQYAVTLPFGANATFFWLLAAKKRPELLRNCHQLPRCPRTLQLKPNR
jgi:hypothetical protein